MKKIVLCDDNELQRKLLADLLQEYFRRNYQEAKIVEYDCGDALAADMEKADLYANVIFMDVYMPGMNGIETAKRLRELNCRSEIVFLTVSEEHAIESYEVQAAGYLLKPVSMEKLSAVLNHIFWTDLRRRIEVKCGRQYRYPYISDIMYIESAGHKATLHLSDGSTIDTIEKISSLQEKIRDSHFFQCHQSYLVNLNYVADIRDELILSNDERIPMSVRRKAETIEQFHIFFRDVVRAKQ